MLAEKRTNRSYTNFQMLLDLSVSERHDAVREQSTNRPMGLKGVPRSKPGGTVHPERESTTNIARERIALPCYKPVTTSGKNVTNALQSQEKSGDHVGK
jgi:hypothetical protein